MATPCRQCGATKTEPVRHGVFYSLAKSLGYHLRRCARCHRLRLLPKSEPKDAPLPPRPGLFRRLIPPGSQAPGAKDPGGCPHCGAQDYRRSHRTTLEHLMGRRPMVRCRSCHKRFPMPKGQSFMAA